MTTTHALPADETAAVPYIRDALRDAIIERRLPPGTKLAEIDVGKLFNASRAFARGALQALSYEGLVRIERNRGAFVAQPSPEEAHEIFAARRQIEPGVVSAAAVNMTPEAGARLRALLEDEQQLMRKPGREARRAEIKVSGDFHLMIAAITGNSIMQRFMEELVARSSLVIALYGQSTVSSCGHREHEEIVIALETGDAEGACRLTLHHIDHILADLDFSARKPADLRQVFQM